MFIEKEHLCGLKILYITELSTVSGNAYDGYYNYYKPTTIGVT